VEMEVNEVGHRVTLTELMLPDRIRVTPPGRIR
jgi:hypothetical protein